MEMLEVQSPGNLILGVKDPAHLFQKGCCKYGVIFIHFL